MTKQQLEQFAEQLFAQAVPNLPKMTERQKTTTMLLAKGLTTEEVGEAMGIKYNGSHCHVKAVYEKLGVQNRAQLVLRLVVASQAGKEVQA
mgnify:CR=1 FL=1